ncbi:pentapeptide repeat-containing protein [Campylobacter lari]|uniref:pentapeptide repeat-containing protein n=1 Tax=Campylobacter lari TaxID=201 RepID=UPI001BD4077C|nr:pentapeptide repeat-containing protein [Campylobacter lari]MBT0817362.1 pentapeptide repeat-containing protein [Campylobacter lari]
MSEFDQTLAQYGILAKNAQKSIQEDRISIFGKAIIEEIDFKILQEKGIKELDISDSKFINVLYIENVYLNFNFFNVHFTDVVQIKEASFDYFILMQCVFEDNFFLDQISSKGQVNFYRTKFNKIVHFVNSEFIGQVDFAEIEFFDKVDFNNIKVKDYINLVNLVFWKVFEINKAHLNSFTIAKKIIFHEEVAFLGIEVEKNIHIFDAKFENKITLGVKDFDKMEFIDSKALGEVDFGQSKGKEVIIKNSNFDNNMMLSYAHFENLLIERSTLKEISLSINNFTLTQNINFKDIAFGKLYIPKELFVKSVDFERCIFLQDMNFKDYTFNEIAFNTCTFKENAYFNNSNFTKGVDFHECEFEKTACFYGVKFDETPNFSQAIFKGNLNAVNTNLNFTFDNLQERIKQEYKDFNKDKNEKDKKSLDKFANDFRDSFRNFKNALIKDNNLLDASKFHKYELYCKEIELNSNDTLLKYERDEVFDKLSLYLKQKVDWCLLLFYRKLSDHHTDLLKVLNNFFILIAVYYVYIITNTKLLEEKDIISSFLKSFSFYGDDKIVAVVKVLPLSYLLLLFFSPIVIFLASLYYTTKQKREIIFEKIKTKFQRCLLATSVFIVICLMLFVINSSFFIPLIKIVIFCGAFFLAIYINSLYLRYYFAISSYIVFSIVIVHYPIILNPLIGKILNDKIKIEDSLTLVITFAYTVLMFLVLFSLQKTARKNSIVPS